MDSQNSFEVCLTGWQQRYREYQNWLKVFQQRKADFDQQMALWQQEQRTHTLEAYQARTGMETGDTFLQE